MSSFRPLFVTSTARSGSYLISMMLSANRDVMIASEPYLELFRSMRNAFVHEGAPADLRASFNPSAPMQDYYFTDERIRLMDLIQASEVTTPFDPAEWPSFKAVAGPRAALQCAELLPYMDALRGATYKEMFDNAFEIIMEARSCRDRKWIGIKDAWVIEFFAPLARAYPDAKFIVIRRDARATIHSNLGGITNEPEAVAHPLSYARHWRKYVAFSTHYANDPLFAGRLHVVTHEQVLREPERSARELCRFLDVEYDPAMLDTNQYFDFATGATWKGNSTFEETTSGISAHRADRWRSKLDPKVIKMVDFVCGHDMKLMGDGPLLEFNEDRWPSADIIDYVIRSGEGYTNWRTDLGDPQQDYGFELFRRALLGLRQPPSDTGLIRRSFLFEDVYAALRRLAAPAE